jgi:hypothetical protein
LIIFFETTLKLGISWKVFNFKYRVLSIKIFHYTYGSFIALDMQVINTISTERPSHTTPTGKLPLIGDNPNSDMQPFVVFFTN